MSLPLRLAQQLEMQEGGWQRILLPDCRQDRKKSYATVSAPQLDQQSCGLKNLTTKVQVNRQVSVVGNRLARFGLARMAAMLINIRLHFIIIRDRSNLLSTPNREDQYTK